MTQTISAERIEEMLPCPFCGSALSIRGGVNGYGRCDTGGCWVNERAIVVPMDDPTQVAAWNRRSALRAQAKPMRLHFDLDAMKQKIKGDPDLEVEAGRMHPEAQNSTTEMGIHGLPQTVIDTAYAAAAEALAGTSSDIGAGELERVVIAALTTLRAQAQGSEAVAKVGRTDPNSGHPIIYATFDGEKGYLVKEGDLLYASPPVQAQPQVTVKALEWNRATEQPMFKGDDPKRFWRAADQLGGWVWVRVHTVDFDGECSFGSHKFTTAAEAKAALESHRASRILSALASPPAPVDGGVTGEMVETDGIGWVFWNPDSGEEYSPDHPVEAGICDDAERIRKSTMQEDVLYAAMQKYFALTASRAAVAQEGKP